MGSKSSRISNWQRSSPDHMATMLSEIRIDLHSKYMRALPVGIRRSLPQQNKVRLEANLVAAHKWDLALSSQLLKLAMDVVGKLSEEAP